MPIPRDYLELGIDPNLDPVMRDVYKFLKEHQDQAYSLDELYRQRHMRGPLSLEAFSKALDALFLLGALEGRTIGGEEYYAWRAEIPSLASRP